MKYQVRKRILQIPSARLVRDWAKRVKLRGGDHLSLYKFSKIFINNIEKDEILDRANGVAFNFVLAIFPTVIFLFTLIPYLTPYFPAIDQDNIMMFLGEYMPTSMFEVVSTTVGDIIHKQRGGLLTLGFVFASYLATNGMMALMRAFNACYQTVEKRSFFKMRMTATGLTVLLAIVLLSAFVLLIVGEIVLNQITYQLSDLSHIKLDGYSLYGLLLLRFAVIFIVFFFAVSFIYYFGPAIHYNWKFFSIGSFLATLGCLAVSYGFSYYITNFGSYNKVYGSIGVLIALMVWIQLLTIVLLFGYEINASMHYGQKLEAIAQHQRAKRRELSKGGKSLTI
ncbi:MAG: YihY/virulence factor BrkB family protein [Cyclobacteriaceae bacterium]|nr:YihY/virulence factor BrkB family protein [Cyclobacteriaceae bacterium]